MAGYAIFNIHETLKIRECTFHCYDKESIQTVLDRIHALETIQVDLHELVQVERQYPALCAKTIPVQTFYGDIAKLIFKNSFSAD